MCAGARARGVKVVGNKKCKNCANYSERKRRKTQCKTHVSARIPQLQVGCKTSIMSEKRITVRQKSYAKKKKGERREKKFEILYFFCET